MNKNKNWYNQICLDYIPFKILDKVSVKHIYIWSDFLNQINFNNMEDVYSYLNIKIKEIEDANTETKE